MVHVALFTSEGPVSSQESAEAIVHRIFADNGMGERKVEFTFLGAALVEFTEEEWGSLQDLGYVEMVSTQGDELQAEMP